MVFAALAGLAPLHAERLGARVARAPVRAALSDPLTFYDTSSYGPLAVEAMHQAVGPAALVHGSDWPYAEPAPLAQPAAARRVRGQPGRAAAAAPGGGGGMTRPPLPDGRDLVGAELRSLVAWLGDRPEVWRPHVRHDPAQRTFHRLLSDAHLTVWLICWMPGHDTGFHDHDGSAGAVAVLDGRVEERLRLLEAPIPVVYGPGEVLEFGASEIHRVRHAERARP